MSKNTRHVVLASGSPRRLQLLRQIGFRPEVFKSRVEEFAQAEESASDYTRRLAKEKAAEVRGRIPDSFAPEAEWILAADTVVVLDGAILEKPADAQDARDMLARLSGSTHEVMTAFAWMHRADERAVVEVVTTEVTLREMTEPMIAQYVDTGEPMDKAGSYGIQGLGAVFVESIRGSYSSVVGLPIAAVVRTLQDLGGLDGFPFAPLDGPPTAHQGQS